MRREERSRPICFIGELTDIQIGCSHKKHFQILPYLYHNYLKYLLVLRLNNFYVVPVLSILVNNFVYSALASIEKARSALAPYWKCLTPEGKQTRDTKLLKKLQSHFIPVKNQRFPQ